MSRHTSWYQYGQESDDGLHGDPSDQQDCLKADKSTDEESRGMYLPARQYHRITGDLLTVYNFPYSVNS